MLLFWGVVLGVAVGFLRGGKIANLENLGVKGLWLIVAALVVQLAIFPLFGDRPLVPFATEAFHIFSYVILAVFVFLNWKVWQIPAMGLGMGLNLAAIASNGGYMPASADSLLRAGEYEVAKNLINHGNYGNVILMDESTTLNALGDWLFLPEWFPLSTAFSIGDLVIAMGLVCFFGFGMVKRKPPS